MKRILIQATGDISIDIEPEDVAPRRRPHSVIFGVPRFLSKTKGVYTVMAIKIPNDAIANVPLMFTDLEGHNIAGDVTNVTATVTDPSVATAAVTSDGNWVAITPLVATGASTCTYTDNSETPALVTTVDFSIVVPQPSVAAFNEAGTVLVPNPNPPAGAAGSTIGGGASTVGGGTDTTGGGTDTTGGAASTGGGASTAGAGSTITGGAA